MVGYDTECSIKDLDAKKFVLQIVAFKLDNLNRICAVLFGKLNSSSRLTLLKIIDFDI